MSSQARYSIPRHLAVTAVSALIGLGSMASAVQAAPDIAQPGTAAPLVLATNDRQDNRQDRRDNHQDRQDNRHDRRDDHQDRQDNRHDRQDRRDDRRD